MKKIMKPRLVLTVLIGGLLTLGSTTILEAKASSLASQNQDEIVTRGPGRGGGPGFRAPGRPGCPGVPGYRYNCPRPCVNPAVAPNCPRFVPGPQQPSAPPDGYQWRRCPNRDGWVMVPVA